MTLWAHKLVNSEAMYLKYAIFVNLGEGEENNNVVAM
jgi:hypothetical protein